jgi:opacity protein-like surface antigen
MQMKRIHVALVLTIAVVGLTLAPMANAARVPSMGTLELNAGYAKSSNEVTGTDQLGGGLTFGAGYWRNASPSVSWGAELGFDNLGNVNYDNGNTTDNQISSSAFRVNPAIRFKFGAPVGPSFHAQAGAGLYNVSMDIKDSVDGNVSQSQSKFGFNVGAGVSFPVGPKTRANLTGLYHSVSTEGESLNYLQFRAGIGFSL